METECIEMQPLASVHQPAAPPDDDLGAPPPYTVADPGWRLTYVDFTPKCIDYGGIVSSAKFETFGVLVARANDYLHRHPTVAVKSMETTKFNVYKTKKPGTVVDTREATFKDTRTSGGILVNALRVWITPKQTTKAQQVGYLNVVPACLHPGGIFKRPKFDTITKTVIKLNTLLEQAPLPGKIINIETIEHHFDEYRKWLQPEKCHWVLHNDLSTSYLSFLRIYYETGSQRPVVIGFKDFVPSKVRVNGPYSIDRNEYESVDDLITSAHQWLMNRHNYKFLNIQTNFNTITKGNSKTVKTDSSLTTQFSTPDLVQTLRLWYTINNSDASPNNAMDLGSSSVRLLSEISDINSAEINSCNARECVTRSDIVGNNTEVATNVNLTSSCLNANEQCNTSDVSNEIVNNFSLKYVTFWPMQLQDGGMFHSVLFESLIDTRRRMKDWVLNTDENVISCETVHIKYDQSRPYDSRSVTHTFHSGSFGYNSTWLSVFRLCVICRNSEIEQSPTVLPSPELSQVL